MLSKDETLKLAKVFANEGFLCSEATLLALSMCLNVENELIPQIATGFGAGIGREGEICGALSGAVIGLGIRFGRNKIEDTDKTDQRPYWYASELLTRFRSQFKNIRCRDLLEMDLSRPENVELYHTKNLWETRCREFILVTTGIAYEILQLEP